MSYSRFAIYYLPPDGPLAAFGAAWLGWDVVRGCTAPQFDMHGLDDITMTPRKYGFHATLKPPFRLKARQTVEALESDTAKLARKLVPVACDGLQLARLGGFLALTPYGAMDGIEHVAAACVKGLDAYRAPPSEAELTRRRAAGLSARQEDHLAQWGYPYVLDEFCFHLTLTGKLPEDAIEHWSNAAHGVLPALPKPFVLNQIALCGERHDGRFELIHRHRLSG